MSSTVFPSLFAHVPAGAFGPLASPNRERYWRLLCRLFDEYFGPDAPLPPSHGFARREIVAALERYLLAEETWEDEGDAPLQGGLAARAAAVYDRLRQAGWLRQDKLGAREMVALDILPSMIEGVKDCVRHMEDNGVAFNLTPICGDICRTEFQAGSFDAIYSNEAIEHVHDIDAMLMECARIMRPGGNLMLINDCNVLNREVRENITAMWHKRERDWKWSDYLRSIRPIEHGGAKPFAIRREEIIRAANPSLTDTVSTTSRPVALTAREGAATGGSGWAAAESAIGVASAIALTPRRIMMRRLPSTCQSPAE